VMEVLLQVEEVFNLTVNKAKGRCPVKFCRNDSKRTHSLCHKHDMELWRRRNPTKAAYASLKWKAKQRGIEFELTFEEFSQLADAHDYIEGRGREVGCLHIDRIDAEGSYALHNVQILTATENSSKARYERKVLLPNGREVRVSQLASLALEDQMSVNENEDEWEEPDWLE
jgi:hypothetical protein